MQKQCPPGASITPMANPNQPPAVIFITQSSDSRNEGRSEMPLKSFHMGFGIIQMIIGGLMLTVEITALCYLIFSYGTGVYCGFFVILPGMLSVFAAKLNSRCLIIACLVMNIIATVVCFVGCISSALEISLNDYIVSAGARRKFGLGKSIVVLMCCIFEFIATIVHASFTCRSFSKCCMPRKIQQPMTTESPSQQGFAYDNHAAYPAQGGELFIPQGAVVIPQGVV